MDLYVWSLLLGAVGLGAMAFTGLGNRGHSGGAHGHGGRPRQRNGAGHGHGPAQRPRPARTVPTSHTGIARADRSGRSRRRASCSASRSDSARPASCCDRCSADRFLSPPRSSAQSLFERALVSPLWNFTMRFASTPANTLESAVDRRSDRRHVVRPERAGHRVARGRRTGRPDSRHASRRTIAVLARRRARGATRSDRRRECRAKNSCTVSLI